MSSVLQQIFCIFKASPLCLRHAWAKYKVQEAHGSEFNQNIETPCNSKLKVTELQNLCIKRRKLKLVKDECMYHSNSKTSAENIASD